MLPRSLFVAAILLILLLQIPIHGSVWGTPPVALAMGLLLGLTVGNPFAAKTKKVSKFLLQFCVVGLGFGMNLQQVIHAGRSGFIYTAVGIAATLAVGFLFGKMFRVPETESTLISVGTAICGGSAIAAVGPVIGARDEQMSVSLGTVFILNSIALLIFPPIGVHFHLDPRQFGLWAALAIHDTSSVVGAATKFGGVALGIATTVKLARALWIVPLSLGAAAVKRKSGQIQWPWFIAFFVLAAVAATYLPAPAVYAWITKLAKLGLTYTLFLIGANVSRKTLKEVGPRPLLLGVTLWILVSVATLWLIRSGVIAL